MFKKQNYFQNFQVLNFAITYGASCKWYRLVKLLEIASCVWSPFYEVHIKHVESVQKKFSLFAFKSLNWDPNINLPSYIHTSFEIIKPS